MYVYVYENKLLTLHIDCTGTWRQRSVNSIVHDTIIFPCMISWGVNKSQVDSMQ